MESFRIWVHPYSTKVGQPENEYLINRTNIQKLLFESSHTHLISAREGSAYIMSLRYNRVASFPHTHIWALYMSIRFHWIVRISYSDDYRLLKRYRNSCQSGIEGSTRRHDTGWTHGFHSKVLLLYIMIGFKYQKKIAAGLQNSLKTYRNLWRKVQTAYAPTGSCRDMRRCVEDSRFTMWRLNVLHWQNRYWLTVNCRRFDWKQSSRTWKQTDRAR